MILDDESKYQYFQKLFLDAYQKVFKVILFGKKNV
jgi:hypothetical protein